MSQKTAARKEEKVLRRRLFNLHALVDEILQEELERRLYRLSPTDELRLFKLITWRDRYKVSIRFILKTLVPYYAEKFKRFSGRKDSLGCKLATLLGKKSEVMLRDAIAREFPNDEHVSLWNQEMQYAILDTEAGDDEEEFISKPKDMLHFNTPAEYIKSYRRRVNVRRRDLQKLVEDPRRKLRQWRGNPFI